CADVHLTNTLLKPKLYRSVIEDVINDVREVFLDEGVDEQVLLELKTVSCSWTQYLQLRNVLTSL
uniref:Uncharacterized protein n=1 Tax=Chelonoidis abingdonii TaxID=106734 RepID=A0A8C0IV58_CHEAB